MSILHHEGDALWAMGSKADAPVAPPASLAAALAEEEAEEARRTQALAAAKAAAEASAIAERIQEIPKLRRKAEKSRRQVILRISTRAPYVCVCVCVCRGGCGGLPAACLVAGFLLEQLVFKFLSFVRVQIEELKAKGGPLDSSQEAKLAREGQVAAEIAALDAELDALIRPHAAEGPGARAGCSANEDRGAADRSAEAAAAEEAEGGGTGDWVVVDGEAVSMETAECGAASDEVQGSHTGAGDGGAGGGGGGGEVNEDDSENEGDDDEGDNEGEGDDLATELLSEDDALFRSSVLTELSLSNPSASAPVLLSVLFGRASLRAGGIGLKRTQWKGSGAFLASLAPGTIGTRTRSSGKPSGEVVEVTGFNAAAAPPFVPVADPSAEGATPSIRVVASKAGRPVQVTARRVRNKNVTSIEYLEEWGLDKESQAILAQDLRRAFSAASAVSERAGTTDNAAKGRRRLWTVQLSGKFVQPVAAFLRDRGIAKVETKLSKGVTLTKKDKQQYK